MPWDRVNSHLGLFTGLGLGQRPFAVQTRPPGHPTRRTRPASVASRTETPPSPLLVIATLNLKFLEHMFESGEQGAERDLRPLPGGGQPGLACRFHNAPAPTGVRNRSWCSQPWPVQLRHVTR